MFDTIVNACKNIFNRIKQKLKQWTKPTTAGIIASSLSDLLRSRADLMAENALLRQQLIVLSRQVKRPQLTTGDRIRLVFLARLTQFWQSALLIVQPDALLRWHRDLFRRYWKWKSKSQNRQPRIPEATIALIKQMAAENHIWGAEKIHGELLKLGITVSKRTIQKYMKTPRQTGQNWTTFLKNHTADIWACDFTIVHTLLFKPLTIPVFLEHQTRQIVHAAVTTSPTDEWAAQQLREATAWGQGPKYLIRDNDSKFGRQFSLVAEATNIKQMTTPFQAPRANALCERFIGTLKRECLDYCLILHTHQLHRVVNEFVAYYNQQRPHQGIGQRIPRQFDKGMRAKSQKPAGAIIATPILNGLHHSYRYAGNLY